MPVHSPICDRAHAWVSRGLDGQLNELSRLALRRHLDRCADCAKYAADVDLFTSVLRDAPLEEYRCDPGAFRRRRQARARRLVPSVAALALVSAVTGVAVSHQLELSQNRAPDYSTSLPTFTPWSQAGEDARMSVRQRIRLPIGQRSAADDFRPDP